MLCGRISDWYMKTKKIKLVHITSSLKMGGAETVLCDLIEHLGSQQFEHIVIYFHEGELLERLRSNGVRVYKVRGLWCMYDPFLFVRIYRLIKKIKPDCIHSLLWAANVTARIVGAFLRIPVVSVFHNNVDQDGALRNALDRLTLSLATQLVAVSDGVADSVRRVHHAPAKQIQVIRNGINVSAVQQRGARHAVARAEFGLDAEYFIIGSVGRFHKVKHFDVLLKSFALVLQSCPQARLMLVGVGDQEQELRAYARELLIDQEVFFVVGQQAYGYYPLFDCFVQPSQEGLSIALLEAMSFAKPVIVASRDGQHAVIQHEYNGLMVPLLDYQELARALRIIIQQPQVRNRLAHAAQQTVKNRFGLQASVNAYKDIFFHVAGQKGKAI